jgi:hypothetical protein
MEPFLAGAAPTWRSCSLRLFTARLRIDRHPRMQGALYLNCSSIDGFNYYRSTMHTCLCRPSATVAAPRSYEAR